MRIDVAIHTSSTSCRNHGGQAYLMASGHSRAKRLPWRGSASWRRRWSALPRAGVADRLPGPSRAGSAVPEGREVDLVGDDERQREVRLVRGLGEGGLLAEHAARGG